MQAKSTVNSNEVEKFDALSGDWWNETSKSFGILHKMNPLRINFILQNIPSLKECKILDIGCGGGILSIPLARLGANVTGIEPSSFACSAAIKKASEENLSVNFLNSSLEDLTETNYDIILLMDVIEHVENPENFFKLLKSKLKIGGMLIISTINNTALSRIFVKFMAEYILRLLPCGTHSTEKFISPEFIIESLPGFIKVACKGFIYNPFTANFKLIDSTSMNYFLSLKRSL